jgi:hypothetical protein
MAMTVPHYESEKQERKAVRFGFPKRTIQENQTWPLFTFFDPWYVGFQGKRSSYWTAL